MNFFKKLKKCYFIAEIGVNHNGNLDLCKKMIIAAKKSGADAVKFQTFKASTLALKNTPKVKYQLSKSSKKETHYEMLKKLELSYKDHIKIRNFCKKNKIEFISTPYDIESAKFLNRIGVKFFKTSSADLTDINLQEYLAKTKKHVIISTGMSNLNEINKTIKLYKKFKNNKYILLHCVSNYPCKDNSINLQSLKVLSDKFKCPIGYSDHSIGNESSIIAAAYKIKLIEKHFTLNKNLKGPDHKTSITPVEFKNLVHSVRRAEIMIGKYSKKVQNEEKEMLNISRKSIVSINAIKKNEKFSIKNISLKRPGTGIKAKYFNYILGKKAKKNIVNNKLISFKDIK
tara:strand:- start:3607 stop:4635 length:1029 start_codon:yes stop_codon:yes gene_type:complete